MISSNKIKDQIEDKTLNQPAAKYFKKKMKCSFVETEFRYAGVRLDVLTYNSDEKCFYICEGKNAKSIANLGHAIGQLISYMSLIQEDGYKFLELITDMHKVNLTQIQRFLQTQIISVKFYVILPFEQKEKMERSIEIVRKNIGEFSKYIGICFANENKFLIYSEPRIKEIGIERKYDKAELFKEVAEQFLSQKGPKNNCEIQKAPNNNVLQFKRKKGNPYLHYEVWIKNVKKAEAHRIIEVGFHIEFASSHLKFKTFKARNAKLIRIINKVSVKIKKKDNSVHLNKKWGKNWSKIYFEIQTKKKNEFSQEETDLIIKKLIAIYEYLNSELEKVKWGRMHEYTENEGESDYGK